MIVQVEWKRYEKLAFFDHHYLAYFEKDTRNGHSYNGSEHELVGDL